MAEDNRKSVLITGCTAPGIGYNLALSFKARGFRVFATARQAEKIAELKDHGVETLSLEVNDRGSIEACFKEVSRLLGPGKGLDYLVNNAGRNYTVPATDIDEHEVELTFATNVFAVMYINQIFVPLLIRARGTILHIGSVVSYYPSLWGAVYNATKAALESYSNTLRIELAPFGVHVVHAVTGGVVSNISRTQRTLRADSLWRAYGEQYEYRQMYSQHVGMDTRRFADSLVASTLGARGYLWNTNKVWVGAKASLVRRVAFLDLLVPGGVWGYVVPRMFGLKSKIEVPESKKID